MKEIQFVSEHYFQELQLPRDDYLKKLNEADAVFIYPCSDPALKDLVFQAAETLDLNGKFVVAEECCERGAGEFFTPINLYQLFFATFTFYFTRNFSSEFAKRLGNGLYKKFFENYLENNDDQNKNPFNFRLTTSSGQEITYRFNSNLKIEDYVLAEKLVGLHFLEMDRLELPSSKTFVYIPELRKWVEA